MSNYEDNQPNLANMHQAYRQASLAANNTQHIIMLYETVIKNVKLAFDAAKENNIEERYNLLDKASDIIDGLQSALDYDNGGEIAKLLDSFYLGMYIRIHQLQITYSEVGYEKLLKEVKMMRDAWVEVDKITSQSKTKGDNAVSQSGIYSSDSSGAKENTQCDIDA